VSILGEESEDKIKYLRIDAISKSLVIYNTFVFDRFKYNDYLINNMEPSSVYIDGETLALLDKYKHKSRVKISRSAIIRAAIHEFVSRDE